MSAPPYRGTSPRGVPPPNPDTRPLPPGWIEQYDWSYKQWYYVNTRDDPPRSSWVHPIVAPPAGYAPPPGPPPGGDRGYGGPGPYGQGPPGGYGGGYDQGPPRSPYGAGGYGGPSPGGYGGPPPGGYGGPSPGQWNYQQEQRGFFGAGPSPQPQTVQVIEERPARKSGPGMGTALLAGGAGLIGGALLEDAWQDHDQSEQEQGYQDGYQDGADYGDDGGGDGGGGDNW